MIVNNILTGEYMETKFIADTDSHETIVFMSNVDIGIMSISMMSGILEWLDNYIVSVDEYTREIDNSSLMNHARIEMGKQVAPHCFSVSVAHQVFFIVKLMDVIKENMLSGKHNYIFIARGQIDLYLKMTKAYKAYEDKLIECNKEVYGEHFGSAVERFNWLEHNAFFEKLLADNP